MRQARQTAFHECFGRAGALFESSAGWKIPEVVTGHAQEYDAIRNGVGISDLSDMGKLLVTGESAATLLDEVVAGNVDRITENSIRWTAILDDRGRVVADVQVYNEFDRFIITCAGPVTDEVLGVLERHRRPGVEIHDMTTELAAVSIEGPMARDVPPALGGMDASGLGLLRFTRCDMDGIAVLLARIGYTGEFGYVFLVAPEVAGSLVERIRAAWPEAVLCGRAVQDVLRLEVRAFNLWRDLLQGETALEAGLHWMIDFRKPAFCGRDAVLAERDRGLTRRLVSFVLHAEGPVTRGAAVRDEGQAAGYVAQALWSPTQERTIGLAYVRATHAWVGVHLEVDQELGSGPIEIVSAPFILTESTKSAAQ